GPRLELWDSTGKVLADGDDALAEAAEAIRQGQIVALKGLGGFQLLVDARNEAAVQRLRIRKRREEKPFAIMVPSLEAAEAEVEIGPLERALLESRQAPIVLLRPRHHVGTGFPAYPAKPADRLESLSPRNIAP